MRKSQWNLLGWAFLMLMVLFISLDLNAEKVCGSLKEEDIVYCINTEIHDPFIYLFFVLWVVCWINCGIEWRHERERKR